MSKQIQSGDEQNLELRKLESCYRKTCRQQTATSRSLEKSIEDDSPEKGKKLRLLNLLQETTFDRT
jgi:hypothetical protein